MVTTLVASLMLHPIRTPRQPVPNTSFWTALLMASLFRTPFEHAELAIDWTGLQIGDIEAHLF